MQSKAKTVPAYLKELPADRRKAICEIRKVINRNLPKGYKEGMQYGMPTWSVPHSIYPDGYHCDPSQALPYVSLASQKNHMALYMACVYADKAHRDWFVKAWKQAGKKLDMGKSCVRFRKLEDVPLEVVAESIGRVSVKEYIAFYETAIKGAGRKRPAKKTSKKKATRKKAAKKATVRRKVSKKKTARRAAKKSTRKTARSRSG